ncbi:MAG: hypothetical protein HOP23_02105 [Methylococcaceae bacterium]|nr:hypothetical protein [Methylococcaceae bacterium]
MKLRFLESEIQSWAKKYQYPRGETSLLDLRAEVQQAGYITKDQLSLVAHWKAPRSAGHVEKNSECYVKEITSWAFSAKEERSRIEVLTLLNGVLWPSASVILHLFHKEPYPILDFRALWSIEQNVPKQYSYSFWWAYVRFCRAVSVRNSVDIRTFDRALWQYSKENQNALLGDQDDAPLRTP